jgi:hypothetical protein
LSLSRGAAVLPLLGISRGNPLSERVFSLDPQKESKMMKAVVIGENVMFFGRAPSRYAGLRENRSSMEGK